MSSLGPAFQTAVKYRVGARSKPGPSRGATSPLNAERSFQNSGFDVS